MNIGRKPRNQYPETVGTYRLIRTHGRFYAAPEHLEILDLLRTGRLFGHPAVFSAATLNEIVAEIDRRGPADAPAMIADLTEQETSARRAGWVYAPGLWASEVCQRPGKIEELTHAGRHRTPPGYDLVEYRGRTHAVRKSAGQVDLDQADDRRRGEVLSGDSLEEVAQRLAARQQAVPVEFAGWLPVYDVSGNCGKHPQFAHADRPPHGYRFTCSAPPAGRPAGLSLVQRIVNKLSVLFVAILVAFRSFYTLACGAAGVGWFARGRIIAAMIRLLWKATVNGAWPWHTLRFIQTRHLRSQLMLGRQRGLVFLTSMPYTLNQFPWVIEIEDPTTLFYPLIQNGQTSEMDFRASPYFPIVKALLEADECKGIITHIRSTAELVRSLFGSEVISQKVIHAPMGVCLPVGERGALSFSPDVYPDQRIQRGDDDLQLLFINSWCQVPSNFYLRGGLDLLEAFHILRQRYPRLRLTMRTALPDLDAHYHRIIEAGAVRVIDRFVTSDEMAQLHAQSDIYLLPAARIHIVSLLQAMGHGLPVIVSDGWGFAEYVEDGRNGLILPGRYGMSSWADIEGGAMREDYSTVYTPDPQIVQGIVAAVTRLIENPDLRMRLGRAARVDVETVYTVDRWNAALQEVFDRARGGSNGENRTGSVSKGLASFAGTDVSGSDSTVLAAVTTR